MSAAVTSISSNRFDCVRQLAAADMAGVDSLIRDRLRSDVALVNQIAEHIVGGGGKRLRPLLHVLGARASGYTGAAHLQLAAVIEFIHTSTLLHDDVVDESGLRRGRKTANALWGNAASVLVGDFLYSRSFQLMVELEDMRVLQILANTTNAIAEGEVLQLLSVGNPDTDEAAYNRFIERKTAVLFAAACQLGGVLAQAPAPLCDALWRYGLELGFAFQIADDLLDYTSDSATLGKNIGDDLAEGKVTLPLIYALRAAPPQRAGILRDAIRNGHGPLEEVQAILNDCGVLPEVRVRAEAHAARAHDALAPLPSGVYRDALAALVDYAIERDH